MQVLISPTTEKMFTGLQQIPETALEISTVCHLVKQARPKSNHIVNIPREARERVPFRRKIRDTVNSLALS